MNSSIIRSWNGRTIRQREDGYLSLTDMAQACGKRVNDWLRLESTKSYVMALAGSAGIPADQLIEVNESLGGNDKRGTWGYRKLAIRFAQWCSDDFAIQVDAWVEELLLKGKVEIVQHHKLSSSDRADKLIAVKDALIVFDIDFANPRFKQELQDFALDILGIGQKSLPEQRETWLGVAERAEELGYPVALVTSNRSQLGKYVATFDMQSTKEKRLCNGTQRPINVYLVTDELDNAIKEFMDAKMLAA